MENTDKIEVPMIEVENVKSGQRFSADRIAIRRDAFAIIVVLGVVVVACFAIWSFS